MFSAKVLLDSQGFHSRLTTMEITYPRIIHAEMLRHRVFSRNTASSRAIPISKVMLQVKDTPFVPIYWGAAQGGMQAYAEVGPLKKWACRFLWLKLRYVAIFFAWMMLKIGLHKQIPNRILEPWVWCTEIISGTQWSNFFHLRCHEAAEPHCQKIAYMIRDAMQASVPKVLEDGEWHVPMAEDLGDETPTRRLAIATGRLARVSYMTHNGVRDVEEDITLHDRLITSGHMSPTEHCAQNTSEQMAEYVMDDNKGYTVANKLLSNFGQGWLQYRKTFIGECK